HGGNRKRIQVIGLIDTTGIRNLNYTFAKRLGGIGSFEGAATWETETFVVEKQKVLPPANFHGITGPPILNPKRLRWFGMMGVYGITQLLSPEAKVVPAAQGRRSTEMPFVKVV